jgi:glycosyltransferase involved in cell wall biosynthesis
MQELMIITSYFPPEIGAASNRIYHLANGLTLNYKVRVVTPLPNYPTGKIFSEYSGRFKSKSIENNIEINRIWLYASKSKNKFIRLFSMLSYSISLIWFFIWNKIPDKVIVQSPPLLVAFTCMFFLKSKKRKLVLNVSDLWPSAGFELGALKKGTSYKFLKKLETFNYKNADLILGQSNEILSHIKQITTKPKLFLYRNYPEIKRSVIAENTPKFNKLKIVYAGLLGVAQGVLKLCQNLDYRDIELHIYGSGAEENDIITFVEAHQNLPIFFYGSIERKELHKVLLQYDVAIIPLRNRIYGSVPSKIFEYAKLGLPMLYFGGGEGESVIKEFNLGWVAEASNYDALNNIISSIKLSGIDMAKKEGIQNEAYNHFDFNTQLHSLLKVL